MRRKVLITSHFPTPSRRPVGETRKETSSSGKSRVLAICGSRAMPVSIARPRHWRRNFLPHPAVSLGFGCSPWNQAPGGGLAVRALCRLWGRWLEHDGWPVRGTAQLFEFNSLIDVSRVLAAPDLHRIVRPCPAEDQNPLGRWITPGRSVWKPARSPAAIRCAST
jgi:hypothetical protein